MLTKLDKANLRGKLFRYLDGFAICSSAYYLKKNGVLQSLLLGQDSTLSELSQKHKANEGYLNVALRLLASQGWLEYDLNADESVSIKTNEKSELAFSLVGLYKDVVELNELSGKYHRRLFNKEPFLVWCKIQESLANNYVLEKQTEPWKNEIQEQVLCHIEGVLVGPSVVALGMSGMFHKYFMDNSFNPGEFHEDKESFTRLLDFFVSLGWFTKNGSAFSFTDTGLFFAKRASAFGVTVSYGATFRQVSELLFGDPNKIWKNDSKGEESHVDREMNVWGSGGAHGTYFKKVDDIIVEIFNRPIAEQPKGIVDVGCGNGAYLIHLFDVIEKRTERGKVLEDHPLMLVGADYNEVALKVTRANLIKADVWAKVIWGDIGRPDLLAKDLKEQYQLDLSDLLNVRTFLDHNRIWSEEAESESLQGATGKSNGAFATRGQRLSPSRVEKNLVHHLGKWKPYVERFGLLLIELHTVSPKLVAKNIGKTAATAYDATHGFSDQYILELQSFLESAAKAGLYPVEKFSSRFPDTELATVSINLLKGKS